MLSFDIDRFASIHADHQKNNLQLSKTTKNNAITTKGMRTFTAYRIGPL